MTSRFSFARAASLLVLVSAGCGVPPMVTPDAGTDGGVARITLGGVDGIDGGFVALADQQDAALIEGAQGGFHVWMKYRVAGLAPGQYQVTRNAHRDRDDKIVLRILPETLTVGPAGGDGYWEAPMAVPMFMCPSPLGVRITDELIRYQIDVLRGDGSTAASGTVRMVPRCPDTPQDKHDFCERICTG